MFYPLTKLANSSPGRCSPHLQHYRPDTSYILKHPDLVEIQMTNLNFPIFNSVSYYYSVPGNAEYSLPCNSFRVQHFDSWAGFLTSWCISYLISTHPYVTGKFTLDSRRPSLGKNSITCSVTRSFLTYYCICGVLDKNSHRHNAVPDLPTLFRDCLESCLFHSQRKEAAPPFRACAHTHQGPRW